MALSVAAIEHCLACWDDAAPLDAAIPAARAQLAALVEAAGRAGALAAALAELLNGGRWSDGYGARKYALRLTGDEHAALHDLLAEAGPGAAGARDETRRWEDGYTEGHEEGWRTGLKAASRLRQALVDLLGSADCSWEEQGGGHDWPEACQEARAAWAEFDALRAGGAGETATPASGTRHPRCTSGQCAMVGACCYSVCIGPLVEALGEGEGERAWFTALRAGGAGDKEAADGG